MSTRSNPWTPSKLGTALLLATGLCACSGTGEGTVSIRIDGEDGAREGLPHDDGEESIEFVDGWSVQFEAYRMAVSGLEVADSMGESGFSSDAVYLVDLALDAPEIEAAVIGAQRWDEVGIGVVVPQSGDELVRSGVGEDQARAMVDAGASYWVDGTARHAASGREVSFSFPFEASARYSRCTNGEDGSQGVVVRTNSETRLDFTVHVEHLFFSNLASENGALRFEAIAAMADDAGLVTWAALADQPLADLRDADGNPLVDEGGAPVVYDPGGVALQENTLQAFMREAVRSQVHLNGEGLCTLSSLD